MKKTAFIAFVFLSGLKNLMGQDPIFTQFYNVPEQMNPSFTAVNGTTKVSLAHRTQWAGLNYSLSTQFANFNSYVDDIKSGFGLTLLNNLETTTRYRFTQATLNYAYRVQLSYDWLFIPSVSFGFGNKDYAFDSLLLEDQINIISGVNNINSIDPILTNNSIQFFDFSAGGLVMNDVFWVGLSLKHLNRPNISFVNNKNISLDPFISFHTGFKFDMNHLNYHWTDSYLFLMANFMNQGPYNRFDIGAEIETNGFTFGAILSTSPSKNDNNAHFLNSINLTTGWVWDDFKIGYSYDINTSSLSNTNGIHEITLTYTFYSLFNGDVGCWRCK